MWTRHTSRSHGTDYLYNSTTHESRWADTGIADAYGAMATSCDDAAGKSMRAEHNMWKRELLRHVVRKGDSVLDVACGRGGDIGKMAHLGARSYVGVDVSRECVAEARRRAAALPIDSRVEVADVGLERLPCSDVDAASCQFALQYLARDPTLLDSLFSELTRVGCRRFVVSVPDHDVVRGMCEGRHEVPASIRTWGDSLPTDEGLHRNPWGHAYDFEFVGRTPRLTEYLVYPPALEDLAVRHGWSLVRRVPGPRLYVGLVFTRRADGPQTS